MHKSMINHLTHTAPAAVSPKDGLSETLCYFADPMACLEIVSRARWPKGPVCPRCGSQELSFIKTRRTWTCLGCRKQFSVKVGTILEDSAIGLDKWLAAMWLVANHGNGISSYEVARDLEVTQRTAWFMLHRIHYARSASRVDRVGDNGSATAPRTMSASA
jgi:transposase-like protein